MQRTMTRSAPCPAAASIAIDALVELRREGQLTVVRVGGVPWAYFDREDAAAENYAMVSLVQGGLATVSAVAKGFGANRVRIYRSIER